MDKQSRSRWSSPATPLQAARFQRKWFGRDVIARIRVLCPGHAGNPCRIDASKLSDYENGNRRPGVKHIEALCCLYQQSPEALGLITWRVPTSGDDENGLPGPNFDALLAAAADDDRAAEQLIDLLAAATAISSAASVACRELRAALQERASVTLA